MSSVWVAGLGMISAIGNNVAESVDSLMLGRSGIAPLSRLDSIHKGILPAGEVKLDNAELAEVSGLNKYSSRTAMLSLIAAREALNDSGINIKSLRCGLISANSVGGMDKSEIFFREFINDNGKGRLRDVAGHECATATNLTAVQLGIKNHVTTISTACSSSANSIFFAARMIRNNMLDIAIAGGADAITGFTLNGFNSLMILDNEPCKPFDENRKGLNLGEGAGYLVLISDKVAEKFNGKIYCRLSGYHNANDAYHQTASSPEGTGSYLAMKGALSRASINISDIGFINLHGTGTLNNDLSEGTAVSRLFENNFPRMSSTKSFTGHTLGASGGIEAVLSALTAREGFVFPTLRHETPMKEFSFTPEKNFSKDLSIMHVMSNSFGFGGNCSTLIFSKQ